MYKRWALQVVRFLDVLFFLLVFCFLTQKNSELGVYAAYGQTVKQSHFTNTVKLAAYKDCRISSMIMLSLVAMF